jgi:hypothetical protein
MEKQGKRWAISVAGVAVIVSALIASQTLTHRASTVRLADTTHPPTSISSQAFTEWQRSLEESRTAAETVPYYRTINGATYYDRLTSQQSVASPVPDALTQVQQRFVENNTTNLPNAVTAETRPAATSDRAPNEDRTVRAQNASGGTSEVNMKALPAGVAPTALRECTHPLVGFPTCYVQQADGMWAREEMADVDTGWVVVGTVTYDEMLAALGEGDASIPALPYGVMP